MKPRTTVHLIPHSHWDREWYSPFQTFRMRLVELVDRVLDMLEADPAFRFTLDGQCATIDDYLEIRPEQEARIRRFVVEGRLAIGPWQILMDEFLCSGETMIRNLELGIQRGRQLGGVTAAGYLPDMFGHVAQMPQLLRRAGIDHAVVWRGVPAAIDHHQFTWSAPDGSTVTTEYLVNGYGNAAHLFAIPGRAADHLALVDQTNQRFGGEDHLLAMYGTDHVMPPPDLSDLVETLNRTQDRYDVRVETLADYLAAAEPAGAVPEWRGEMRSSARANLLMGVNSARIDLKQAGGRAELALERYAEPLGALWGDPAAIPDTYLRLAWRRIIENSAHDSICGCSLDEVVDQVIVRYAEAEQIARGLTARAAAYVAADLPRDATAVLNPTASARTGLVEVSVPIPIEWEAVAFETGDGESLPTQELTRSAPVTFVEQMSGREVPDIYRRIHGRELFGRYLRGYSVGIVDGRYEVRFEVDTEPDPEWLDVDEMKRTIDEAIAAAPDEPWRVRVVEAARRTLLVQVPVPPLGMTAIRPREGATGTVDPVVASNDRLSNGLLVVEVNSEGTLRLEAIDGTVLEGVGRLVDGGDRGDSYNHAPPAVDRLVDTPLRVSHRVLESGPLRAIVEIVRAYRWPTGLAPETADSAESAADTTMRSIDEVEVPITTRVELRAGEPYVRLAFSLENHSDDHRLRFHVPLARATDTSAAEGQFAVVERAGKPDAGHGEVPLPTYPARTFVDAGGAAILADHIIEYELVERRELAVTVLRATGLISRDDNAYREDPAGPQLAIPNGQCRRAWRFSLAVMPHRGEWHEAGVLEAAERYRAGLVTSPGTSSDPMTPLPASRSGLALSGRGVALSALRRVGTELELRVVAEHPAADEAIVEGSFRSAYEVDLLGHPTGNPIRVTGGTLRLPIRPWEIRTLRLSDTP
jgi:2-O-(6-phospho-alpha-D-mannosyl)-D-glycerate hydrolase